MKLLPVNYYSHQVTMTKLRNAQAELKVQQGEDEWLSSYSRQSNGLPILVQMHHAHHASTSSFAFFRPSESSILKEQEGRNHQNLRIKAV